AGAPPVYAMVVGIQVRKMDRARRRSMVMQTTYGQFCPVAKASEVIAERWTPLIVREIALGSHRFNDLERGLPRISRSLLSSRLRQLERAGVVERRAAGRRRVGYYLTQAGGGMGPSI